ncbi:MAG: glutathione S-transferase family protein [Deltaproteobacteria bacterium]
MKLYTFDGAPNPRRVQIFLAEKGIEIPTEQVNIMKGESRKPEFRERVNLMGGLPVLELDDGSHIAESIAICRYLEACHPEPALFGGNAREQAHVEMWTRRIEFNFMVPVGLVWIHGSPLTKAVVKSQIPEVAEQNRDTVRNYFQFLDRHLEQHEFLAGSSFSVADITAFCTLEFAANLNDLPHTSEQKHLSRWATALAARPSIAS